jgi:hypothetical protein
MRIVPPSSVPSGILMRTRSDSTTMPSPWHVGQTVLPVRPVPLHVGHGFSRRSDSAAGSAEDRVAKRDFDLAADVLPGSGPVERRARPPKMLPKRSPKSPVSK